MIMEHRDKSMTAVIDIIAVCLAAEAVHQRFVYVRNTVSCVCNDQRNVEHAAQHCALSKAVVVLYSL